MSVTYHTDFELNACSSGRRCKIYPTTFRYAACLVTILFKTTSVESNSATALQNRELTELHNHFINLPFLNNTKLGGSLNREGFYNNTTILVTGTYNLHNLKPR